MLFRSKAGRTVMPGRTHMQHAQPVLLAHQLMAHAWPLLRDVQRLVDWDRRIDASPYGSGALAGNTLGLDPEAVAHELGFSRVTTNSIDGTASRDLVAEFAFVAAMAGVDVSRLAEEIIIWNTQEFAFVKLDDAYSTGSSIMPQKKNPDFAELVRGKTGRVVGDLTGLLVTVKATPLTYDKDLQEDKEPLFDAADTVLGSLMACSGMLATCTFKEERLREASHEGYMAATDLADYLVGKGLPFRQAHAVVGRIVGDCVREGVTLQALTTDELRSYSELFDDDAHDALDIDSIVRRRTTYGGTGHDAVRTQLGEAREHVRANEAVLA